MKPIRFELATGAHITFVNKPLSIYERLDGQIFIEDGTHNNGGWELHRNTTYQIVMDIITKAQEQS